MANLSRSTRVLHGSNQNEEVVVETDSEVQAQKTAKKWDRSNANIIAQANSDEDMDKQIHQYFNSKKSKVEPISLSAAKQYREGHEFEKTGKILGSGNSAGKIEEVRDKKTGQKHALKTIRSGFREEEKRCMVEMSASGYVPSLYHVVNEENTVYMHMEKLENAETLRSISDDYMVHFYQNEVTMLLVRPFSLYVLHRLLEAVAKMHSLDWAHLDLHGGNIMLQKTVLDKLIVKLLDFGNARKNRQNLDGFKADICEVMRLFSSLYTGQQFKDRYDLQQNWKSELEEITKWMSVDDRKELLCLMDAAMKIVNRADIGDLMKDMQEFRELVKKHLKKVDKVDYADASGNHHDKIGQYGGLPKPDLENTSKCVSNEFGINLK